MSLLDPGTLTIECDHCGKTKEVNCAQYADNTFGVEDSTIEDEGWLVDGDQHYCETCREEYE